MKSTTRPGTRSRWMPMLLATIAVATSPFTSAAAPKEARLAHGRPAWHETVELGTNGVWMGSAVLLARSAAEWDAAMSDLDSRGELLVSPGLPAPAIDWSRNGAVLVAMGYCPTGGYGIEVRDVRRLGRTLVLDVALRVPGSGLCDQLPTSPYHVVAVDRNGIDNFTCRYVAASSSAAEALGRKMPMGTASVDGAGFEAAASQASFTIETWGQLKEAYRR